jgi:hypothetical protein
MTETLDDMLAIVRALGPSREAEAVLLHPTACARLREASTGIEPDPTARLWGLPLYVSRFCPPEQALTGPVSRIAALARLLDAMEGVEGFTVEAARELIDALAGKADDTTEEEDQP